MFFFFFKQSKISKRYQFLNTEKENKNIRFDNNMQVERKPLFSASKKGSSDGLSLSFM